MSGTNNSVAKIILSFILALAVFTASCYSCSFGIFWIPPIIFAIVYFIVGFILKKYIDKKYVVNTFIITTLLLILFALIKGFALIRMNSLYMVMLIVSFYVGYKLSSWKSNQRYIAISVIPFLYFFLVFFVMPRWQYFSSDRSLLSGKKIETITKKISVIDSKGIPIDIDFKEGHVYLVEFYFKNCVPCILKEPFLNSINEEFDNSDFSIIYLQSGSADNFDTFLEVCKESGEYNRFYDKDGRISEALGIRGYPFEIIIDKKGEIRYSLSGFGQVYQQIYLNDNIKKIKDLLNE